MSNYLSPADCSAKEGDIVMICGMPDRLIRCAKCGYLLPWIEMRDSTAGPHEQVCRECSNQQNH